MWELDQSDRRQNVASFLRNELECSICLSPYKLPTTLPCGHTFCRYCVGRTSTCPLCRHRVAPNMSLSVNMVLHNLLKNASGLNSYGSTPGLASLIESSSSSDSDHIEKELNNCEQLRRMRRQGRNLRSFAASRSLSPPIVLDPEAKTSPAEETTGATRSLGSFPFREFWQINIGKPFVPLNVFARLLVYELLAKVPPVMANDLIACLTQIAKADGLFQPVEGMLSEQTAERLLEAMESPQSPESLQAWVERTVESNMHFILHSGPWTTRGRLSAFGDKLLRVTEAEHELPRIPLSVGRHAANDLVIPHSSVSSYHLLIREPAKHENVNAPLVLHDVGSSVGTMVKLESHEILQDGWILHLGDKVEFKVGLSHTPRSDSLWDVKERRVVSHGGAESPALLKIISTLTLTRVSQKLQTLWTIPATGAVLGSKSETNEPTRRAKIAIICPDRSYISPEHCLITFCGTPPAWRVISLSNHGTYRRLQPFSDLVPLDKPVALKIGQCRATVTPSDTMRK